MPSNLDQISERVRQNRTARQTALDGNLANPSTVARVAAGTFAAGDRVLDVATGRHGTVTGAGLPDALQRNDVRVALDDGRVVIRSPDGVLFRPTPPAPAAAGARG